MTESSTKANPNESPHKQSSEETDAIDELRRLLVGPEQVKISHLKERFENPELRAQDVSGVLPEAIKIRSARDDKIAKVLEPSIENAIKASIKRDRRVLVDALFPVMGPAIRKAISSTILGMIQSFNQILDHSFSIQGLKWRIEALKTNKPFAEVVLINTLLYQVEQIFFIHKDTGLVLQHVGAKGVAAQDPDLVSSMLTGIMDFVSDSFGAEKDESLDTLRIGGDRSVWVEQGPHALLAAVIRGTPPLDVRTVLSEMLDDLHVQQNEDLEAFQGDTTPFEAVRSRLEACLQFQVKQTPKKPSPLLWTILVGLFIAVGLWSFSAYRNHQQWKHLVEKLHKEPGIVIAVFEKRSGKYHISGLRDPLASDPAVMLKETKLDPDMAVFNWEPFHSIAPEFMLKRINAVLRPPQTVTLKLKNNVLYAHGSAFQKWIVAARKQAGNIPGIEHYSDDTIVDIDQRLRPPQTVTLELKNNILIVYGSADHRWIVAARKGVGSLPGIVAFKADHLVDIDKREIQKIEKKIEKTVIYFVIGKTELINDQKDTLHKVMGDINKLYELAQVLDKRVYVEIVGHTDSIGKEETKMKISQKRADNVLSFLVSNGFKSERFNSTGIGSKEPLKKEITALDRTFNRCVTFRVILDHRPK